MKQEITHRAKTIKRKKKAVKIAKISFLVFSLGMFAAYLIISFVYNGGNFSITLDRNLFLKNGIIIYDDPTYKVFRTELYAEATPSFSNISHKWLPENLDKQDGSHNGDNYMAYTFYIENRGKAIADYWSEIIIDDVVKNLDDALRIRLYKNGVPTTYAKKAFNGKPEQDTVPFKDEASVTLEEVTDFKPGDKNKYTIVIWLEGSDPECTNNIIGGEIKMHMEFNSENVRPATKTKK